MSFPDLSKKHTYEDWKKWDGSWELINGKAYNMTPAPSPSHQYVVGEIFFALRSFFHQEDYVFTAPLDVFFSEEKNFDKPDHITQPDISVICNKDQIDNKGCFGAPHLIVEVLSPSTALRDYNEKFELYEKHGVEEYWIVDMANKMVHVYKLEDGKYTKRITYGEQDQLKSEIFPALVIDLKRVLEFK